MVSRPALAHPDETLRTVAYRMAKHGVTRMPVVERDHPARLVGLVLPARSPPTVRAPVSGA